MKPYCLACDEDGVPCECLAPCPGCGALSGYTCRSYCPNLPAVIASQTREDDAMRNDDWDDGLPEKEGYEDVDEPQ